MNWEALFKGEYIKAAEFSGKTPTLTIASVKVVALEGDDGKTTDRGVVYFKETPRGWVLNRTNAARLAGMFGREVESWTGKRVTLAAQEVRLGQEKVEGIRVIGSPDIEGPIDVKVKLPRRRPESVRLEKTGAKP